MKLVKLKIQKEGWLQIIRTNVKDLEGNGT